jgi:hypothetical protein
MKHIHKKFNLQGAGGWSSVFGGGSKKAEIKPAVLNPPNLGNFQTAGSNAIAESIDLLCDGPIEGLVSQDGKKLNSNTGQIDMSQLPSGTYVIKVSSDDTSKVFKVIKR